MSYKVQKQKRLKSNCKIILNSAEIYGLFQYCTSTLIYQNLIENLKNETETKDHKTLHTTRFSQNLTYSYRWVESTDIIKQIIVTENDWRCVHTFRATENDSEAFSFWDWAKLYNFKALKQKRNKKIKEWKKEDQLGLSDSVQLRTCSHENARLQRTGFGAHEYQPL